MLTGKAMLKTSRMHDRHAERDVFIENPAIRLMIQIYERMETLLYLIDFI